MKIFLKNIYFMKQFPENYPEGISKRAVIRHESAGIPALHLSIKALKSDGILDEEGTDNGTILMTHCLLFG